VNGSAAFTIGVTARCRDGVCGHLTQVVLDPVGDRVSHLIVEPEHRVGLGRLVPIELAQPHPDHVDLDCTRAEFDRLHIAEQVQFLPGIDGYAGYEPHETLLWPYYGGNATVPIVEDTLPVGEVAVQRGEQVHATDGRIGEVEGLVVEAGTHRVSHVLLKEGHLFGHKQVAIPIAAVQEVGDGVVTLSITKHEVGDLPATDVSR
jgi:sporulation protein YlmC with PRC-barrel domain